MRLLSVLQVPHRLAFGMVSGQRVTGAVFGLQAAAAGDELRHQGTLCLLREFLPAGGQELAEEAKSTLVTQLIARRRGLQAKDGPCDTLTAHHPKGKPVWDLED